MDKLRSKMGLNRLLSLSKNSVLPEIKPVNQKGTKTTQKTGWEREKFKEKTKIQDTSENELKKIDKNVANVKSLTGTKKSMIWSTLRITSKSKSSSKKGKYICVNI